MPDINMCGGVGCKLKKKCYRYTAIPKPYGQAYGSFKPDTNAGGCESFWDNEGRHKD